MHEGKGVLAVGELTKPDSIMPKRLLDVAIHFPHLRQRSFGPPIFFHNPLDFLAEGLNVLRPRGKIEEGVCEAL